MGELARRKDSGIDLAKPRGHQRQFPRLATRAEHCDVTSELLAYQADRLYQIGIVRDDDRCLEVVIEGIDQQMRRNVDVGSLLFRLDDLYEACPVGKRRNEWHHGRADEEVAEMHGQVGKGLESAEERGLAHRTMRIPAWPCRDACSEEADSIDVIMHRKREPAHLRDVDPPVRGVLQAAKVEIPGVDVDVRAPRCGTRTNHPIPLLNAETARRRSCAQPPKRLGGYTISLPPPSP